jgi:hypothetical protein
MGTGERIAEDRWRQASSRSRPGKPGREAVRRCDGPDRRWRRRTDDTGCGANGVRVPPATLRFRPRVRRRPARRSGHNPRVADLRRR